MDDRKILDHYPLPIAGGYRRWRNASEVRERHDAAYYLFEVYLKYAASVAVSRYLAGEARDHRVNAALKGLARPSIGEWVKFLRESLRFLSQEPEPDPAVGALRALESEKESRWRNVLRLYNALRAFREGGASAREKVSLGMLLEELVTYRNRLLGHGAPLSREHYERFGALLGDAFPEILAESPFLTALRLVSFDTVQVEAGTRIECGVVEHMSDRPIRRERPLVIPYGGKAPEKGKLYLLSGEAQFLSMDPLLVAYRDDVYFLNEADGGAEYLSYTTGERYRPPGAGEDQARLFERILGYQVDSSRLSRIGDDLKAAEVGAEAGKDGERKLGDYRILREVGRGAMGIVCEAVQESLGRRVALKVLPGSFALEPRRVERFRREARATARVHHPSIVPVYEVGEADGNHYYAMEFIDGPSLAAVLARAREESATRKKPGSSAASDPTYIARAVERMAELSEGLEKAHELGLIHRDVKPSNILLDPSGRYVLVDFGLVHETEAETLTRSGEMVGTLSYMSPEQVSRGKVDRRADVYGLGVTLYEVLTLRTPYEGKTEHEVQRAILFEEPAAPRKLNPRLNRDLETIILEALEKNPEKRYASAGELAADLRRFLRYEPIRARAQSRWSRALRRAAKHKTSVAALATIVTLLLAVGILVLKDYNAECARRIEAYEPTVLQAAMEMQLAGLNLKWGTGYLAHMDRHVAYFRRDFQVLSRAPGRAPIERALAKLAEAESAVPGRTDAYYHRARGLLLLERNLEAAKELDLALERDPDFVPALLLRESLQDAPGRKPGGEPGARKSSVATQDSWAQAWISASRAITEGRWKDAADAYGKLIQFEKRGKERYLGSLVEAYLGHGVAHLEDDKFQEAIEDFLEAKAHMQHSPQPALLLGKTYYLMARKKEVFKELFERTPLKDDIAIEVSGFYFAYYETQNALDWAEKMTADLSIRERQRCICFFNSGRTAEGIDAGQKAIKLDAQDALSYAALAQNHLWGGDKAKVGDLVDRALALDPGNPTVLHRVGGIFRHTDLKRMFDTYYKLIDIDPSSPWPHQWLAEALFFSEGKKAEAYAEIKKAIDLEPKYFNLYFLMGQMVEADGDYSNALVNYCRSLVLHPTNSDAIDSLYSLLRRQDRQEQTLAAPDPLAVVVEKLERLIHWGADDIQPILKTLALALIHTPKGKEPERALKYARRAVEETRGQDPGPLATLAEVQFFAGEPVEAIRTMEDALKLPGATWQLQHQLEGYRKTSPEPVTYASIDARLESLNRRALVPAGATWRYFPGKCEPPAEWMALGFNDASWEKGPSGFGYGDKDDGTELEGMPGAYTSVYVRHEFALPDPAGFRGLVLSVTVDDGFVAYLNGGEVARSNVDPAVTRIPFDGLALNAIEPTSLVYKLDPKLLRPGKNVLALQGLNSSKASSDLSLIPVLEAELPPDPEGGRKLLESLGRGGSDPGKASRLAYLEGKILEAAAKHAEAAEKLSQVVNLDPTRPEPFLRVAECLRSAGDPATAEKRLREALGTSLKTHADLWNLWFALSSLDLKQTPKEIMEHFPDPKGFYGEDIRWVLEKLAQDAAVRINCAGEDHLDPKGRLWGRDRFFRGGKPFANGARFTLEIRGAADDELYRKDRWFPSEELDPSYRIPLPPGRYQVILHFAELAFLRPGSRVFHVRIEGEEKLKEYEPLRAGFATAREESFTVEVKDAMLDIEFVRHRDNPQVCAIEIEERN